MQPHQVILYVTNKWDKHLSHSSRFFYLAELFPWTAGMGSTHCTPCFSCHLGRADPQSRPPGWPHMVQWDAAESADTTGSPLPSSSLIRLPPQSLSPSPSSPDPALGLLGLCVLVMISTGRCSTSCWWIKVCWDHFSPPVHWMGFSYWDLLRTWNGLAPADVTTWCSTGIHPHVSRWMYFLLCLNCPFPSLCPLPPYIHLCPPCCFICSNLIITYIDGG